MLRFPASIGSTVWAGKNDRVTVQIAQPAFPMVRTAVLTRRWVAMAGQDHLDFHRFSTSHCCIEIVDLKPQEDAVSVRLEIWISNRTVMVLDIPSVQLKDQLAADNKAFILRSAVRTLAAEQLLVPSTACLDVADAN